MTPPPLREGATIIAAVKRLVPLLLSGLLACSPAPPADPTGPDLLAASLRLDALGRPLLHELTPLGARPWQRLIPLRTAAGPRTASLHLTPRSLRLSAGDCAGCLALRGVVEAVVYLGPQRAHQADLLPLGHGRATFTAQARLRPGAVAVGTQLERGSLELPELDLAPLPDMTGLRRSDPDEQRLVLDDTAVQAALSSAASALLDESLTRALERAALARPRGLKRGDTVTAEVSEGLLHVGVSGRRRAFDAPALSWPTPGVGQDISLAVTPAWLRRAAGAPPRLLAHNNTLVARLRWQVPSGGWMLLQGPIEPRGNGADGLTVHADTAPRVLASAGLGASAPDEEARQRAFVESLGGLTGALQPWPLRGPSETEPQLLLARPAGAAWVLDGALSQRRSRARRAAPPRPPSPTGRPRVPRRP